MEIFENFRIWRFKLRKQLFGSEYVFKIEFLINVKRVEGIMKFYITLQLIKGM